MKPVSVAGELDSDPASCPSCESGVTLVEILIVLVIMGILGASILVALQTVIRSSSTSSATARLEAVASAAADRLGTAPYVRCATPSSYRSAVEGAGGPVGWAPSTIEITVIEYWNGTAFVPTCQLTSTLSAVQKITVKVSAPTGTSTRILEVVKSDVAPTQL